MNIQNVNATLKESGVVVKAKKTLSSELKLAEDRMDHMQLLDFIYVPEAQLFILVYTSKICFFDKDSIFKQQEDRMRHMNLFINGVKTLVKGTLGKYKKPDSDHTDSKESNNFLLVSSKVANFNRVY